MKPNNVDSHIQVDPRIASDLTEMSKAAGTTNANLLAALVWMGKKAFGREVRIQGQDERQTLRINSFAGLDRIGEVGHTDKKSAAAAVETEESDEEFPEDFEDYYPRGYLDTPKAAGTVTLDEKREDTRGRLAVIYTIATFLMFVLGFAVSILDAVIRQTSIVDNLTKILPLLSGIFLGSLGFVLGYYFRKVEGESTTPRSTSTNS